METKFRNTDQVPISTEISRSETFLYQQIIVYT